ncbi:MAG: hypothetical protein QNJ81_03680 [Acidimicrobiia bacterium]|nr:hypothetical protein [Acidimicrobiia bacterium]
MAYSDFAPPRRSRRRRNIVILTIIALIVGVLVLAVRYRTERRESIDYLTAAEEVALQHGDMSEQLAAVLQGLGQAGQEDRPELELRLETLSADASEMVKVLEAQVVPRPVGEVAGLMSVAVDAWAEGIDTLDASVVLILDAEDGDESGDEGLRSSFELIRLGDRAYERAVAATLRLDPELVPAPLPEISYTQGQYGPLYNHVVVAERLRRQGGLAELIDVALVANTVPQPVSQDTAGIWTIPASEELALEVTVSNTGNVVVERVSVLVTLQRVGSSEEFTPLVQLIPAIEPGQSENLIFSNLEAAPDEVYSLTATATVEGRDDQTDDNSFNLIFKRNAE